MTVIDTQAMDVEHGPMMRTKRTYNLSPGAVAQVRELAGQAGLPDSQDAVVEEAIARLYRDVRAQAEAEAWTRASEDPSFRREVAELRAVYDREAWPE